MTWVTVGVSIGSSVLGSRSEKKAAKLRAEAYGEASAITGRAYDEAEELLDPRYQQEQDAMARVNTLLGLPGGDGSDPTEVLRNTPGYQWRFNQGQQATERVLAGQGGFVSGNTLAALQEYGQGMADQGFNDYLTTVLGLQDQGVDRTRAGLRVERGNILSDYRLGAGGARASGVTGAANALVGGASSVLDTINYNRGLKRPQPPMPTKVGGPVLVPGGFLPYTPRP